MHKFLYEAKPLIMIGVAILAIIQIDDKSSLFEISGYVLFVTALWILFARLKHRGYVGSKNESSETEE